MKRRYAVFAVTFVVSLLIGIQAVEVANANPMELGKIYQEQEISPQSVDAKPPKITFQSPLQNKTYGSAVTLRCNITGGEFNTNQNASIAYLSYKGDWEKATTSVQFKGTWGIDKLYVKGDLTYFSTNLTVPEGKHNITVWASELGGYQQDTGKKFQGSELITVYTFHLSTSETAYFTVDCKTPTISILSLGNKTYSTSDVLLEFNVDESSAQFTYCLDGLSATSVVGNSTLTNLPNGNHSITMYAVDEAGNVGASETVTFNISNQQHFPTVTVATVLIALVVIAGAGLMVYFKRRRGIQ